MRFAIDAREITGEPTGVGRVVGGLLQAWPADGNDELILYARQPVPWEFLRDNTRARVAAGPRSMPGAVWEQVVLPRLLKRDRIDALFSPAYGMPLAAPCPTVVGMHDCACEATPAEFGWRQRRRRQWVARRACRRAAFLWCGSRFAAEEIQRWYDVPAERIVRADYGLGATFRDVAPEAIESARQRYALGGRTVLFVGAPLARRGLGALAAAVAELRRTRPDVELCFVGPRHQPSAVTDQLPAATDQPVTVADQPAPVIVPPSSVANQSSAATDQPGLRWLGYVPEEDLAAVYAAATVMAYSSSYEGFGFPVLEAIACGTPVVASACGSLPEIFGAHATLVANDPQAWQAALAVALDDEGGRQRRVEAAQRWARSRSWGPAARLLRHLLRRAAHARRAANSRRAAA